MVGIAARPRRRFAGQTGHGETTTPDELALQCRHHFGTSAFYPVTETDTALKQPRTTQEEPVSPAFNIKKLTASRHNGPSP